MCEAALSHVFGSVHLVDRPWRAPPPTHNTTWSGARFEIDYTKVRVGTALGRAAPTTIGGLGNCIGGASELVEIASAPKGRLGELKLCNGCRELLRALSVMRLPQRGRNAG